MSKTFKFLHVMTHRNSTHNGSIINMINNNSHFNKMEHMFIMANKTSYNDFKHYENVIINEDVIDSDMKVFNEYASQSEYVFLHFNIFTPLQIFKINKNVITKIIWCVWGEHYLYIPTFKVKGLHKSIKRFFGNYARYLSNIRMKKFHAIGIGFKFDSIAVRKRFGDIRILATPYGYQKNKLLEFNRRVVDLNNDNDYEQKSCRIMIGHSAYPRLQHIKILNMLSKFKNEDILISLILSYGDLEYAKKIEEYANEQFPGKVEIIKEYMSSDIYIDYLKTVDICILDYEEQVALGNFWRLLYLGKKIFLNDKGILKLAARLEGAQTFDADIINSISYEEFVRPITNIVANRKVAEFYIDENNYLNMWINTFKELI